MRLQSFAFLGLVALALGAATACSNTVESEQTSGSTGSGGQEASTSSSTGAGASTTGTTTSVSSSSSSSGSDVFPAPHPPPPVVITGGGPVLASPKIVPIFFSNDDPTEEAQIQDFVSKIGGSTYWSTCVSEYGVGAATALAPVELTETATGMMSDTDVQAWLSGKLNMNDPSFPAPDANTVYAIHYPSAVTIVEPDPQTGGNVESCQQIGGYHNSLSLDAAHDGMAVPYAVIPRCASFDGLNGIDSVTGSESHELIEASTDPLPSMNPAWVETDEEHLYWDLALGGGEIGDMCAQNPNAFYKNAELGYTVQRTWSNSSAKAGHDPCVPELPGEVYFNAAPVMNQTVPLTIEGQTIDLNGVVIPVGGSLTIPVDLFSDGPTNGPFTVQAVDYNMLVGGSPNLSFSWDDTSGENGDVLHLTIHVMAKGQFGIEMFVLAASQGQNQNLWVGDVGQ